MVNKAAKVVLAVLCLGWISGCASQASIDSLRADMESQMGTISANADEALREARSARELSQQANARASEASNQANEAAAIAEETNSKLGRMFKKSMMK